MANIGSLVASISVETSQLRSGLSKTRNMFRSATGKIGSSIKTVSRSVFSLTGAVVGLAAAAGGIGLAKSFIEAADTTEKFNITLNSLLGSAKEGNMLFKDMTEFAAGVPFEFEKIMGSAVQLAGVFEGGREEIKKWMPLIADISATWDLPIEKTTEQIVRMYSSGAASADLFRERGITAALGFESGVSLSAKKTREQLIKAFEDPESKFRGVTAKLAKTWGGLVSMLMDRWFQFRVMVADTGAFDAIKTALEVILKSIDKMAKSGALQEWAEGVGKTFLTVVGWIISVTGKLPLIWIEVKRAVSLVLLAVTELAWMMVDLITLGTSLGDSLKKSISGASKFLAESVVNAEALETKFAGWSIEADQFADKISKMGEAIKKTREDAGEGAPGLGGGGGADTGGGEGLARLDKEQRQQLTDLQKQTEQVTKGITSAWEQSFLSQAEMAQDWSDTQQQTLANLVVANEDALENRFISEADFVARRTALEDAILEAQQVTADTLRELGDEEHEMWLEKLEEKEELSLSQIETERERLVEQFAERLELVKGSQEAEMALRMSHADALIMLELKREKKEQTIQAASAKVKMDMLKQFGTNMAAQKGAMGKVGVAIEKGFKIKEAIMSTYSMATKSYDALAGIPYIGPVLGAIAAGAAIAFGLKQISVIKSAHKGLTSAPAEEPILINRGERVITPEQNTDLTRFLARDTIGEEGTETGGTAAPVEDRSFVPVTLEIDGNVLARAMAPAIIEAKDDGVQFEEDGG